jgi:hypothetical protein
MNHLKKGAKVALLGENYFPPMSTSHVSLRRGKSLRKIMNAIIHYEPSVVYVCPTKGVNINLLPLLLMHEIKIRLVFPSKHFFSNLGGDEKGILDAACAKADKIIILSDEKCDIRKWADDWYKASKRTIDSSDWVMLIHTPEFANSAFDDLVLKFEKNPKPVLAIGLGQVE